MPKDSILWQEFQKRIDRLAWTERRVVEERLRTNYRRERYQFVTEGEAALLQAVLDRIIPQDEGEDKIDLVGFLDWAIPLPLGYGDRPERVPDDPTIFREGLRGVAQTARGMFAGRSFQQLSDGDKDRVLRAVQEGRAEGGVWQRIPGPVFFRKLMVKALNGYCAHPKVWARIGFYGPAYPEGYVWISRHEVEARRARKPGYIDF